MLLALAWGLGVQSNAQPTPQTGCREVPSLPLGAPSNSCSARDVHSRVDEPGAHSTTLHLLRGLHDWAWRSSILFLHCFQGEMDGERLEIVMG